MSFGSFALLLPQMCKAHGGAQFPGLGFLAPGNLNRLEETYFGLALGSGGQGSRIGFYFCPALRFRSSQLMLRLASATARLLSYVRLGVCSFI